MSPSPIEEVKTLLYMAGDALNSDSRSSPGARQYSAGPNKASMAEQSIAYTLLAIAKLMLREQTHG